MSEMQDAINQILSNPEAMKQVQSLGEQLGLSKPEPPKPAAPQNELSGALQSLAPLMQGGADDDISRLFAALRPFLGEEKRRKLDQAQRLMKLIRVIPLIKDSGLFF